MPERASLAPGDAVHCEMTKWGEHPHWVYDALWLGSDEHGDWVGVPTGTRFARPGRELTAGSDQVVLVPAPSYGVRPGWLATFHQAGGAVWAGEPSPPEPVAAAPRVATYVDMTTPAQWHGATLRAVDLDLDVVQDVAGTVVVDDEDEFAAHQVELGYPAHVVTAALQSCAWVHAAVVAASAPFDGAHRAWLDRLRELRG
ncbi:DUF402 domain-containing protein [Nocardioides houyundeii]|uniref:DUF402 domain-containing protein n=1 Tax=Nocardioides houyundeii TaxID=2045452 RepID=UPI000DF2B404|nr:DUF402 domain-containing protein [Nocardioides houyundeii]